MKYIDVAEQELDILALEAKFYIAQIPAESAGIFLEAEGKSIFQKIMDKLKDIIDKVKKKITDFINSTVFKKKVKELETTLDENPELKNVKVKIPDYEKVHKLNNDTLIILDKSNDTEKLMEKYRKQRNKLLGALTVTVVTAGAALVFLKKYSDKKIAVLDEALKKSNKIVHKLNDENINLTKSNKELNDANSTLRTAVDDLKMELDKKNTRNPIKKVKIAGAQFNTRVQYKSDQIKNSASEKQAAAQATVEVVTNQGKDILSSIANIGKAIVDPDKTGIKKTVSVMQKTGDAFDSVAGVFNGKAKEKATSNLSTKYRNNIQHLNKQIEKAQNVINDPNASEERKANAQKYIDSASGKISRFQTKVGKLSNNK